MLRIVERSGNSRKYNDGKREPPGINVLSETDGQRQEKQNKCRAAFFYTTINGKYTKNYEAKDS